MSSLYYNCKVIFRSLKLLDEIVEPVFLLKKVFMTLFSIQIEHSALMLSLNLCWNIVQQLNQVFQLQKTYNFTNSKLITFL